MRIFWIITFGLSFFCERSFGQEREIYDNIEFTYGNRLPQELTICHREGTGLGYSIGYSSLDLFLSKSFCSQPIVSFLDLRGHVFNNGKMAGNVGLGMRYLNYCTQQILGINVAYDHLQNTRRSYDQVGAGFEIIGENWDFHLNAYVPIGRKKTNIYRFRYAFYEAFRDDDLSRLKFGLKAREQLALNGFDTLIGYRICNLFCGDLHISGGPFYYWGNTAKTKNAFNSKHRSALGGRVLIDISFKKYLALSTNVSYDSIFKWCGQVAITLNIPFNFNFQHRSGCCTFRDRVFDRVARNEIIVVDCLNRFSNDPRVLDPEFNP